MAFLSKLIKQWDLYKKVPEDLYVSTYSGVILSIFGITLMTLLFAFEFSNFLTVTHTTDLILDHGESSLGHEGIITINFNVSLHDLPCQFASIDVFDITGTRKHDVNTNIVKTRMDHKGRHLGVLEAHAVEPEEAPSVEHRETAELEALLQEDVDEEAHSDVLTTGTFESYLQDHKDELVMVDFFAPWCIWCRRLEPVWQNTARKLMGSHHKVKSPIRLASVDCTKESALCQKHYIRAYPTIYMFLHGDSKPREAYHGERTTTALISRAHKVYEGDMHEADQKKRELHAEDQQDMTAKGHDDMGHEGCNVAGRLMVKRVPGNFHLNLHSPRYSHDHELVNASHTVHRLNFGDPVTEHRIQNIMYLQGSLPDGLQSDFLTDHLDNKVFIAQMKNYTYVHYLKVVSKKYEGFSSKYPALHTYLYSAFSNEHKEDTVLPSVMIQYDLSPMTVVARYKKQPFYHFITNFCAIIGGVFSIIGIIDRLFQTVAAGFNKKIL